MNILNIVTSPRKEKSASTAIVNAFLSEYRTHVGDVTVDRLDIWQEQLPEFDAEAINAKYKGVSGESMTPVAAKAKAGCPVSKLTKVEIGFGATLLS
jgi:FMN-dependent NADH-azoreductase